ncbi:MAG: hypothetical protein HY537_00745 [Deltaproteobacteria bacterium]|nr:hypothetical protein [Deltaproteobacteria bacterium]
MAVRWQDVRILVFALIWAISCARLDSGSSGSGSGGGANAPAGTTVFSVTVSSRWEGAADATVQKVCTVTNSDPVGSTVSCTTTIPEAELYYSDLIFDINVTSGFCELVRFRPYIYLASTSNSFDSYWANTTIDCSVADIPAGCYSGAGIGMAPGFPTNFGTYFTSASGLQKTYTATAANTYRQSVSGSISNRWTSNTLIDRNTNCSSVGSGDGYAGFYQDWQVLCDDKWNERQYGMTLYIADEDQPGVSISDGHNDMAAWEACN